MTGKVETAVLEAAAVEGDARAVTARGSRALAGSVPPRHPGASWPPPWNPDATQGAKVDFLGSGGIDHRPLVIGAAGGTLAHCVRQVFLLKSPCQTDAPETYTLISHATSCTSLHKAISPRNTHT